MGEGRTVGWRLVAQFIPMGVKWMGEKDLAFKTCTAFQRLGAIRITQLHLQTNTRHRIWCSCCHRSPRERHLIFI